MKLFAKIVTGLAFVTLVSSVHALPFTSVFTPASAVNLTSTSGTYNYTHNLFTEGFNPSIHTLTNATLTIQLSGSLGHNGTLTLDLHSVYSGKFNNLSGDGVNVNLVNLQDGVLNIGLRKTSGPASAATSFVSSTLYVVGTTATPPQVPAPVPEPATLALLGLGLGLAGSRLLMRRRRSAV